MFHQRAMLRVLFVLSLAVFAISALLGYRALGYWLSAGVMGIGVLFVVLFVPKKDWYQFEDDETGVTMLALSESTRSLIREDEILNAEGQSDISAGAVLQALSESSLILAREDDISESQGSDPNESTAEEARPTEPTDNTDW